MTLTKADIAEAIWNKTDIPKWRSAELVESIFEAIKERLESGEDVLISGFGKFCVKEKQERRGRNPQTGEPNNTGAQEGCHFQVCFGVEG